VLWDGLKVRRARALQDAATRAEARKSHITFGIVFMALFLLGFG